MRKKYIFWICLILIFLVLTSCGFKSKVSNKEFEKAVVKTENGYKLKNQKDYKIKVRDEVSIYKEMHSMANTKIIAEDGQIWGKEQITDEKVNALILEVAASNFSDKQQLLDILNRWKKHDFSKADQDHNYVWRKLNGNVGKASGVKSD